MNKQELLALLRGMLESGDTSNVLDLVETGVNEIVKDARRESSAEGYSEGYNDGIRAVYEATNEGDSSA